MPGNSIGLGDLIEQMLKVPLPKAMSGSDWRIRPLSRAQVAYALDDVRYLHDLKTSLTERLQQMGRWGWMAEEMQAPRVSKPLVPALDLWQAVRRVGKLKDDPSALSVLREMAAWRDITAESADLSPILLARDDVLVTLAKMQPTTVAELQTISGLKPATVRYHGSAILRAVQRGLQGNDEALELPADLDRTNEAKSHSSSLQHYLQAWIWHKSALASVNAALMTPYVGPTSLLCIFGFPACPLVCFLSTFCIFSSRLLGFF